MNKHLKINEIIQLVVIEMPGRFDIINALQECNEKDGKWIDDSYIQFIDSTNPNMP